MSSPPLPRRADDDVLVKGILDGDPGALDALFSAWFPRVWTMACSGERTRADAERLTEAAFTDLIAQLPTRAPGTPFSAFLLARIRAAERRLGLVRAGGPSLA